MRTKVTTSENKKIKIWNQITSLPYLHMYRDLIIGSLELEVYSDLTDWNTVEAISEKHGWNKDNTEYMLNGLTALGYIIHKDNLYKNCDECNKYLVKGRPEYVGGFILYSTKLRDMVPLSIKDLVENGGDRSNIKCTDFNLELLDYGDELRKAQAGYRQRTLLKILRRIPGNKERLRVLDLGCATGLLGLAVVNDNINRTGVLFDCIDKSVIEESIRMAGLEDRVEAIQGNFLTDDIGSGYDIILCISIMRYTRSDLENFMKKLYNALNKNGIVVVISEGIESDLSAPWDSVLGYLPFYMNKINPSVEKDIIKDTAEKIGFEVFEHKKSLLCSGNKYIDVFIK